MIALALIVAQAFAQLDGGLQLEPAVAVDVAELHDAPDAGELGPAAAAIGPDAAAADRANLLTDLGWRIVRDGCWLPSARCLHTGKEIARLKAENADLRRAPSLLSREAWVVVGAAALLFAVGGLALGWYVRGLLD